MAEYLPILPRSGLWLFHTDGNGPRFARLFAETWRRVPLCGRRRILKFWREHRPSGGPSRGWPHIELIEDKSNFHHSDGEGEVVGQAQKRGGQLAFKSGAVDNAPVETVVAMIGHELAHVYHYAVDPVYSQAGCDCEGPVFDVLVDWGFDPDPDLAAIKRSPAGRPRRAKPATPERRGARQ